MIIMAHAINSINIISYDITKYELSVSLEKFCDSYDL